MMCTYRRNIVVQKRTSYYPAIHQHNMYNRNGISHYWIRERLCEKVRDGTGSEKDTGKRRRGRKVIATRKVLFCNY